MASETKAMADETAKMAKETERMAQAAVEQQRAALRPVLVLRIQHEVDSDKIPDVKNFGIEVFNVGAGPALDTRVYVESPINYRVSQTPVQPLAIAALAAESVLFTFTFDTYAPFSDPDDPLRWPRNAEDADLIRAAEEAKRTSSGKKHDSPEVKQSTEAARARWGQEIQYRKELLDRIDTLREGGRVRADYRDLLGSSHTSTAKLLLSPHNWHDTTREEEKPGYHSFEEGWRPLTLGPLDVKQRDTESDA
jgi:hypothetical protein